MRFYESKHKDKEILTHNYEDIFKIFKILKCSKFYSLSEYVFKKIVRSPNHILQDPQKSVFLHFNLHNYYEDVDRFLSNININDQWTLNNNFH